MHPAPWLALSAALAFGVAANAATPPPPSAAGAELFTRKGCIGCHALKGHEGAEGQMGPDLSRIARERDREFLVAWIQAPQVHKPGSRMPTLDLTSKEAELLADYLLSERPRKGKRR